MKEVFKLEITNVITENYIYSIFESKEEAKKQARLVVKMLHLKPLTTDIIISENRSITTLIASNGVIFTLEIEKTELNESFDLEDLNFLTEEEEEE